MKAAFLFMLLGVFLSFDAFVYAEGEQRAQAAVDYETFATLVEKNHPEESLNQLAISRALESEKKAGVLMDPDLAVGRDQVPFRAGEMNQDMSSSRAMWRLNITQMFPWPGTLDAEEAAATATTNRTQAESKISSAQLVFFAKEFFVRLVGAAKILVVERENVNESTNVYKNAAMRLKQGIGSHHDLIQAENEKVVLSLNTSAMEADFQNLKGYAALLVGKDNAEDVTFVMELPPINPPIISDPGSLKEGDLKEEKLAAVRSEATMKLEAERKKSLPSFMASGMAMKEDSGMQAYGFMVGVKIPIYSGGVRRAIEGEKAIASRQASEELQWHEKRKRLAILQNKRRQEALLANRNSLKNEVVPNARQHLRTLAIEYSQGKSSFAAVNTARKLLLRYQVSQIIAERDLALAMIARERIDVGLFESELNQPLPQLTTADMASGSGMDVSNMNSSMGKPRTPPKQIPADRPVAPGMPDQEERGETPSGSGMGGMDGM